MTAPVRALIFDFGGVVIRWDPRRLYRRFLDDAGIEEFFREIDFFGWNLEQDRGRPWEPAVADLCAAYPHRAELIRAYDQRFDETIAGPIDGTVRILERLRAAGYPLVGLTNWSSSTFRQTERRYEMFRLFDEIVVSGEVGLLKPDPEIFELTLCRIGRRAEECVFVDDIEKNVIAAAALGFRAIHFRSPEQLEDELIGHGVLPGPC
ncbi:MAG TPA: HAD family phosphatase [Thermoanaerobaculia bacterium]|nr:HAD family phosphatase [Thermoanaerobaculia bacterium]